jgi:hypothetical protein
LVLGWSFFLQFSKRAPGWRKWCALGALLLPVILVFVIGKIEGVRVSPRYLMPAFPPLIAVTAVCLAVLWRVTAARVLVIVFLGFMLASSLELRFTARHKKEDYRRAAAFVKTQLEAGRTVYWGADVQTAIYYGVMNERQRDGSSPRVFIGHVANATPIPAACTVVVLSRLDIYDTTGKVRDFIRDQQMRIVADFTGFRIYVTAPEKAQTPSS